MDPNQFREARLEINRLFNEIEQCIEKKAAQPSKEIHEKASDLLDELSPQAEGEIQERSVKNLGMKMNMLQGQIKKLKPKKSSAARTSSEPIEPWDEDRVSQLSESYLDKVLGNMGDDLKAGVCFRMTGKGVRPSYQIEYSDDNKKAFSGSGHKGLKRALPDDPNTISQLFSRQVLESIVKGK